MHNYCLQIEWDKNFSFFKLTTLQCQRRPSSQNSGKPLGGRGSAAPNPAGSSQRSPSQWAGGLLLPPQTAPQLSAFGFDFRPFMPHWAASPTVFLPQCLGVWTVLTVNVQQAYFCNKQIFFSETSKASKALNFAELFNLFTSSEEYTTPFVLYRIFHQKSVDNFF